MGGGAWGGVWSGLTEADSRALASTMFPVRCSWAYYGLMSECLDVSSLSKRILPAGLIELVY